MNISFIYSFQWTVEMNGVWRFSFSSALRIKWDCGQFYLASETPKQQIGSENVTKWYLQLLKLVYVKKKC